MDKKASMATGSTRKDKKRLLSGVLILTFANVLVKIFGLIYKIPLNTALGEKFYVTNAAYSIYNTLYMISTAGIPVAISILVSECRTRGDVLRLKRVFRVSILTLIIVGSVGTLLMFGTAGILSEINSNGESFWSICAIAPALLLIAVCSVYRGYYQGFQQMTPTAVSELLESFFKMAFGLLFVHLSLNHFGQSKATAAAFTELSTTIGILIGMCYLIFIRYRYRQSDKLSMFGDAVANESVTDESPILRRLASIAIPISLSAVMLNIAALIDSQIMMPLLNNYLGDAAKAEAICSDYSAGAITLYNLPTIFIYPISCSIVPYISAALESGDRTSVRRVTNSALRVTSLVSLPCALGMSALSGPILDLVFGAGDSAMAFNAGPLLKILAISVFLVSMLSVTNALLQAHHQEKKPMISMAAGLAVKVVSDLILTRQFGAYGAPISTVLFHMTVVCFNFYFVLRHTDARPHFIAVFFRPFVAALTSAGGAVLFYRLLTEYVVGARVATILSILGAALIYLVAVFIFRCISEDDITLLPKGEKLNRILHSMHLLR